MPKKTDPALRSRAVRLVAEHQQEYPSLTAACQAVSRQLGIGQESVRRWVSQAQIDSGVRGSCAARAAHATTPPHSVGAVRLRCCISISPVDGLKK